MVRRPNQLARLEAASNVGAEPWLDPLLMRKFPLFTDIMAAAERRIPKRIGGYFFAGADSEAGLAENTAAFERIRLVPRYGVEIGGGDTTVEIFGKTYAAPIGMAPVGYTSAIWPGAERQLAAEAQRIGLPFITSTFAIERLETIKAIAPDVAWLQLYYFTNREISMDLIERAKRAGYEVLVLTIDIPVYSKRTRDHRNGMEFPPSRSASLIAEVISKPAWLRGFLRQPFPMPGNLMPYASDPNGGNAALTELLARTEILPFTWEDFAAVRKAWPGKLVVKGIQHPADALAAVAAGADGVIVSNHGGRQLDAAPAAIDTLPLVADAIGVKAAVMMDSGVRSGLDIAKALIRGAQCCFAGRAFVASCAAIGENGARHAISLFRDEFATALGQLGVESAAALHGNRDREWHPQTAR